MLDHDMITQPQAVEPNTLLGTVFKKTLGHYGVSVDGAMIDCELSNRLRKILIYPIADPSSLRPRVVSVADIRAVDPVAIGDVVALIPAGDGAGLIVGVEERSNALIRRAAGNKPLEQVIVANVDQAVAIMAAAQPAPKWELLDRYLVAAESCGIPARICITKLDLADRSQLEAEIAVYRRIGYAVLLTSTLSGEGVEELKAAFAGQRSVLIGKSGVGKTSLLNALQPGLGLRVNEVSRSSSKGKHTTTHLEMFPLSIGGSVVDTPGMREFALWNIADRELAEYFPEFRPLLGECRFGASCSHDHEPGCGIKAAVADGRISARRHQSYLRMKG
jgi:ribosome biogenesis GTPase / thiamine phosphate phosphatase